MAPTNLIDQLVRDEGEILFAYPDSKGYWTIGSGILIDHRKGGGITHEENQYLVGNRAEKARAAVRTRIPFSLGLDEVRRAVLENMAYNMGIDGVLEFHDMLGRLEAGDFPGAAAAGIDSLWVKETGKRAIRLMKQLESGQWQ